MVTEMKILLAYPFGICISHISSSACTSAAMFCTYTWVPSLRYFDYPISEPNITSKIDVGPDFPSFHSRVRNFPHPWLVLFSNCTALLYLHLSTLPPFLCITCIPFLSRSTTYRKMVFQARIAEHIEIHCESSLSISIPVSQQRCGSHALWSNAKRQT